MKSMWLREGSIRQAWSNRASREKNLASAEVSAFTEGENKRFFLMVFSEMDCESACQSFLSSEVDQVV